MLLDTEIIFHVDCGGEILAGGAPLDSPGFPDPYPPELDCLWTVRAAPGWTINVTSEYFGLEEQTECLWDFMEIWDGEVEEISNKTRFCGYDSITFQSSQNSIHIYFHTDFSGTDVGFRLLFTANPSENALYSNCNRTLTSESGYLSSPNYPLKYLPGTFCRYLIQAPFGKQVELEFLDFNVETYPCDFDKVVVLDGESEDAEQVAILCGSGIHRTIVSSREAMLVIFSTDSSLQTTGFNATYRFRIAPTTTETTTTSTSTTTTPATATTAETTPATTTNAETTPEATTLGTATTTTVGTVTTTNSSEEINAASATSFTEAPSSLPEGSDDCFSIEDSLAGNVTSPNYPGSYQHDLHCVAIIQAASPSAIVIEFVHFDVEFAENCTYDSLTLVSDSLLNTSSPSNETLCGDDLQTKIYTFETKAVRLIFKSDISINKSGYFAKYSVTPLKKDDECALQCDNGGVCQIDDTATSDDKWRCRCPSGFEGDMCEIPVHRETCGNHMCDNGGTCAVSHGKQTCDCLDGYTGKHCETKLHMSVENGDLEFTKIPLNMTVSLGSNILMECAVADSRANIMWLHRDRILSEEDHSSGIEVHPRGVLIIPDATEELDGKYTCVAVVLGELYEKSAWITLREPCELRVQKAPKNATVQEGGRVLFQCYVPDGDQILWRKDGDIIRLDRRKKVLVNNYLMISRIVETDAGEYTCTARGINGCSARRTAVLTVQRKARHGECGRPALSKDNSQVFRVASGRDAPEGSSPWHVIVWENNKRMPYCGGSLLNNRWVLTAAHCVSEFKATFGYSFHKDSIDLYLGTRSCQGNNGIQRRLKNYSLYPGFNGYNFDNDLALFELDQPVTYSDLIMPICLERPLFVDELLKGGRLGVVTGCGNLFEDGPSPVNLNEVKIPYVSRNICRGRAKAMNASFTKGMICAGYSRSMLGDACAGDSGGPYIMQYGGRWVQVGIVSWGVGCDRKNQYGYYTHVSRFYDWISSVASLGA